MPGPRAQSRPGIAWSCPIGPALLGGAEALVVSEEALQDLNDIADVDTAAVVEVVGILARGAAEIHGELTEEIADHIADVEQPVVWILLHEATRRNVGARVLLQVPDDRQRFQNVDILANHDFLARTGVDHDIGALFCVSASIRVDSQGKAYGQMLLSKSIAIPVALLGSAESAPP